jgi:hypothetical protein
VSWLRRGPHPLLAEIVVVGVGLVVALLLPRQPTCADFTGLSWASVLVLVLALLPAYVTMYWSLQWLRGTDRSWKGPAPLRRLGVVMATLVSFGVILVAAFAAVGATFSALGLGCFAA